MTTDRPTSQLLSAPGARWLLASSIVARLPLAMFSIALLVHTQRLTGSFAVAGLVCSAYAICGAVSAPVLGRLVDRRGQTRVLAGGSALTAGFLICIGLLPAGTPAAGLIVLAACAGLTTPPLEGCVRTLLPNIAVRRSDLPALFALESTMLELTFVFGPPLALGLGALWSTGAALVVSGLVMIAGAAGFVLQPASRSWRPDALQTRRAAGSLQSNAIRVLIAIELGTGIVFGATEVGVTATAQHLAAAAAAAPILGLWGLGSLLGGIVTTRIGGGAKSAPGLVALILVLAVTHGALLLGIDSLPVMGVIILLAGATIAPTASSLYALVDRTAPAGTHTEAFSWLAAAASTGAAIGAAIAGVLAQGTGPAGVFAFAGATGLVAAAVALQHAHHLAAPEPMLGEPLPT
ncbi:MAG: MFS transporter [Solirubrobacteraceae bacterium]